MSYRQVEQATEKTTAAHKQNLTEQESVAQQNTAVSSLTATGGDPNTQAANLHQQTNGNLARAGNTLLKLQKQYGNRYVQRLINHQQSLTVQQSSREVEQRNPKEEATRPNNTGLPDSLKTGVEDLSGYSMDDVKVHFNSDKPSKLQAHAYAQGTNIHVASGQEKQLPHEAWHVVQQKQGRVKPTMQMKGEVNVNDDELLETEADVMGARALQRAGIDNVIKSKPLSLNPGLGIVQRAVWYFYAGGWHDENGAPAGVIHNFPATHPDGRVWNTGDTYDDAPVAAGPVVLPIVFGPVHGDRHFGGNPTKKKSKWTISKEDALAMMSQEITDRMQDIVAAVRASATGAVALLLIEDATGPIGDSYLNKGIVTFQIQLQATMEEISYHGFPDDKALNTGLGGSRNTLN